MIASPFTVAPKHTHTRTRGPASRDDNHPTDPYPRAPHTHERRHDNAGHIHRGTRRSFLCRSYTLLITTSNAIINHIFAFSFSISSLSSSSRSRAFSSISPCSTPRISAHSESAVHTSFISSENTSSRVNRFSISGDRSTSSSSRPSRLYSSLSGSKKPGASSWSGMTNRASFLYPRGTFATSGWSLPRRSSSYSSYPPSASGILWMASTAVSFSRSRSFSASRRPSRPRRCCWRRPAEGPP